MLVDLGAGRDADVAAEPGEPVQLVVRAAGGTGRLWSLDVVDGDCRVAGHDVAAATGRGAGVDDAGVDEAWVDDAGVDGAGVGATTGAMGGATVDRFVVVPGTGACTLALSLRAPWRPRAEREHRVRLRWGTA